MGEDPEGAEEDSELSDNSDEEDARRVWLLRSSAAKIV